MAEHQGFRELDALMRNAADKYPVGSEYVHYKDPNSRYEVVGHAILEAHDIAAIEYIDPVYPTVKFVRPMSSWSEKVEYQGNSVPRFTPVD